MPFGAVVRDAETRGDAMEDFLEEASPIFFNIKFSLQSHDCSG